jgi:hypothetical protein
MEMSLGELLSLPLNDGGNGEELVDVNNLQLRVVLKKFIGKQYR